MRSLLAAALLVALPLFAEPPEMPGMTPVPLRNGSFEDAFEEGLPAGWQAYKSASPKRRRELVDVPGGKALKLVDEDTAEEIGIQQTFPATPKLYYQLSARAMALPDTPADDFYLQLRFLPSNRLAQVQLKAGHDGFSTTRVHLTAPADTTQARIYIYSSRPARTSILVDDITLASATITDIAELEKVKPRVTKTVLENVAVVTPEEPGWDKLGDELSALLAKATGQPPARVAPKDANLREKRLFVLLGNIGNNRAFLFPYSHGFTFADGLVPGPGGYDVRTVHDPFGDGRNLIVLGASDPAGAKLAIGELGKHLSPGTRSLPPVFAAKLAGEAAERWGRAFTDKLDEKWVKKQHAAAEKGLKEGMHTGLFRYAEGLGTNYALTHRPEYAQMFVWMVQRAYRHYQSKPATYGGPWGMDSDFRIYKVFPAWDAVEECPSLTDEQRLEVTKILYQWVSDLAHKGVARGNSVRFNHITFPALGCFYAGEYFWNHYEAWQGKLWLEQARNVFEFQSKTTKPHCDCNSYQWLTIDHVMLYAMASGDLTQFENGCARRNADYVVLNMNGLGYQAPYGDVGAWTCWGPSIEVLRKAYWYYRDPKIGWALQRKEAIRTSPMLRGYNLPVTKTTVPNELAGLDVWPLTRPWYDTFARAGDADFSLAFDKISFRDGFDPESTYLLLDGLARGGHGHRDANAVLQWTQNGRIWLADTDYIKSLPKYHNTLLVLKDGQSAPLPSFAELLTATDLPGMAVSATKMSDYAGLDWTRTVFWIKSGSFVVVDRVQAREAGDYSVRAVWQTLGNCQLRDGALDVEQHGQHARIALSTNATAVLSQDDEQAKNWRTYPHVDDPTVQVLQGIVRAKLQPGQSRTFATLLHASGEEASSMRLVSLWGDAFAVLGGPEPMVLAVGDAKDRINLGEVGSFSARALVLTPRQAWAAHFQSVSNQIMFKRMPEPVDLSVDLTNGEATIATATGTRSEVWQLDTTPGEVADVIGGLVGAAYTPRRKKAADEGVKALQAVWSFLDKPDGYLVTANTGGVNRVDAGMKVSCSPAPREANLFNGKPGENTTTNLFDGVLEGVPAATQWGKDEEATLDLAFAQPIDLLRLQLDAWFAASSSKGEIFQLGRIQVLAGDSPDSLKPLADQRDEGTHPSWGTPVPYELPLAGTARCVRLILTPRPGTGVYLAELRLWGKAAWLDQRRLASGSPGDPYLCAVLDDLDGDGNEDVALGSKGGVLLRLDEQGNPVARMDCRRTVRALAAVDFGGGPRTLVAGGDDACVFGFAPDGKALWEYAIPRYKKTGVVRVLTPVHTAKGQLVLAGADNWRYHALDGKGQYLWHLETVHDSTAACAADLDGDGAQEAILGTSYYWWTAASGDGRELWRYRTRGGPGANVVAAADLDGDGKQEALFGGEDTLVQAATPAGKPLWQFNTGDEVTGLLCADLTGDGKPAVVASSLSFNVYALDGKGQLLWRTDLGAPVVKLATLAGKRLVAACGDGTVAVLDAKGTVVARGTVDATPLALATRGAHILVTDAKGYATLFVEE
jgi:outer membrane protein assembly factor BamB